MAETVSNKCNLIINYLPQSLSDQEFFDLFAAVGKTTSTRIIRDKATNYSFGYGFVNYESADDAAKAIQELNGKALQHKTIKVAYSQPSGTQTKNINLHISNLPANATEESVREIFQPYGTIVQCRVVKNANSSQGQGIAFVLYTNRDEALAAIKAVNGILYPGTDDNIVAVKFAKTEQKGPSAAYVKRVAQSNYSYNAGFRGGRGRGRGGGPVRGHSFLGRYSPMTSRGNMANSYGSLMGSGDARYQPPAVETIVFVYGIGPITDENTLWQMFSPFGAIVCGSTCLTDGEIRLKVDSTAKPQAILQSLQKWLLVKRVNVIWDHAKGVGKGYGFVTYSNYNEAMYAVQSMNGSMYEGRNLQVSIKNEEAAF